MLMLAVAANNNGFVINPHLTNRHNSPQETELTRPNRIRFPLFPCSTNLKYLPSLSTHYSFKSHYPNPSENHFPSQTLIFFLFFAALISLRFFATFLPSDFPLRWHRLIALSAEAEACAKDYPSHLWQAVVASEDRRFFRHCGIDPIGVSRAVLSFSAGGGGSTITQQLVKNVFLKDERKISRKFVEILLALILERNMSKWKLLCSYLSKIYWGHGLYGIESASAFYFGKHPSLLSLGESAMLVGIIPAPERLSPLRDPSRGIASQARALRRMVQAGFLDIETALLILKEPLCLRVGGAKHVNGLSQSLHFSSEESGEPGRKIGRSSVIKEIWDWEKASSIWEVREYMEEWAVTIKRRNAAFLSIGKSN